MSAISRKIQVLPGDEKHRPGLKLSLQGCHLHLEKGKKNDHKVKNAALAFKLSLKGCCPHVEKKEKKLPGGEKFCLASSSVCRDVAHVWKYLSAVLGSTAVP